jgi:cytochrome c-type biogenesis protein CcmH/NrfG
MVSNNKYNLTGKTLPEGVRHPETFTMNEFIEREQAAKPKGKKWLFNLLIVLVLLRELVMLPYYIAVGIYKWVRKLTTKVQ